MTERWLYAWALGSVTFGGASLLVPLYAVQLGATPVDLGLLASTAALAGAPGAILFGRLADGVGSRRRLALATLATVAATMAAIPFLGGVTTVIVANAVLWLFVSAVAPVLTMIVVDAAPASAWDERIGRLNKFQGYGWAGGLALGTAWPVVGRWLPVPETEALFGLLAVCAAASAVGAVRTLPRPERHVTGERRVRRIARLVARSDRAVKGATFPFTPNRLFWTTRKLDPRQLFDRLTPALGLYLGAAVLFFTGFAAFWAPLPLLLTDAAFGSGLVFGLYLVSSLASAVLYEVAGRLAARYEPRLLQSGALAARGLLFPVVALAVGLGALPARLGGVAVGLVLVGATWAVIAVVGTAIVTRLAPPAVRGEVLGAYTALAAVAGGVGGVLGGWLATRGYVVAFAVAGGLVVVGAGGVLWLDRVASPAPATETPAAE